MCPATRQVRTMWARTMNREIKMETELFLLTTTYETFIDNDGATRPIRIEIFVSTSVKKKYRARLWSSNTYDMYPWEFNSRRGLTASNYSSDEICFELTSSV